MAVGYHDYYETLGVSRDASPEDIRAQYRKLARQYHPDVNKEPGAEDRFKEIAEAHEVLRDPEKRERYDQMGAGWRAGQDVSGGGGARGRDAGYSDFSGFSGFDDVRVDFGDGDGQFSDFFENLFGGRGGGGGARTRGGRTRAADGFATRGGDQEAEIELTLEEAAHGGSRHITLTDGREFDVTIPRGVTDGQRIRLAGEGSRGIGGGPPGDLLLRVRIRPHPRFRVEGRDLHTDLDVAPWEAALGATVEVQTLDGTARVKVPPGSSSGRKLRLRGEGLPAQRGNPGDLYVHVRIVVPKRLTARERELFEQLAAESKFDPRKQSSR